MFQIEYDHAVVDRSTGKTVVTHHILLPLSDEPEAKMTAGSLRANKRVSNVEVVVVEQQSGTLWS